MKIMAHHESGNVLVFILIGVALFGALGFTFMRSGQQGTGNLSSQQVKIAAGEVLSYAQQMERAVGKIRTRRVSESDISFEINGDYVNAACAVDSCKVFNAAGGQMTWQTPPSGANDATNWAITGAVRVSKIGTDGIVASNADLTAFLPNVVLAVCLDINNRLGIANPSDAPPVATGAVSFATKFTGTFAPGNLLTAAQIDGKAAGCYRDGANYHFYQVLLAR